MATERQAPDAILAQTGLTGTLADIDEDPDAPDANWLAASGNNVNTAVRTSFATPTGSPTVGVGLQEFRFQVRRTSGSGTVDPTARAELWEDGILVRAGSDNTVTSDTGQVFSFVWNGNELGTADGSLVELKVVGTKSGGSPAKRSAVDVGAVEWNVAFSSAVTVDVGVGSLALTPFPAAIQSNVEILVGTASLSLTPFQASINSAIFVNTTAPAITLTPQPAVVKVDTAIAVGMAALTLSSFPATITIPSNTEVLVGAASLALTPFPVNINAATLVSTTTPTITLTPHPTTIKVDTAIDVGVAALVLTSQPAMVKVDASVDVGVAALVLTAHAATVEEGGGDEQIFTNASTMGGDVSIRIGYDHLSLGGA